jgi:hypothetical protein
VGKAQLQRERVLSYACKLNRNYSIIHVMQCRRSGMFIADPNFSFPDPGQKDSRCRIQFRIVEFKYFQAKKLFLSSHKS